MKKRYIYQIAGVFALSGWLTACQNESELTVPETDDAKVCTLTCTMEAGAQSRASVGYGDEDDQTVKWNLGDQILVLQQTADDSEVEWNPMWFTNTDAEGSTANFKHTMKDNSDRLVPERRLCAIYPAFGSSEDEGGSEESEQSGIVREVITSDYSVDVSLDINKEGFDTLTNNSELSVKDYQRNHIVMTAAGTVGEESTLLEFRHHTAMFHVVYTNASGNPQQIKSIRLNPTLPYEDEDQLLANAYFGTKATVYCLSGEQETKGFVCQLGLQFTNPVSVQNGATAHFYLVSFPGRAAVTDDAIDIAVETTEGTVNLGTPLKVEEIVAAVGEDKETGAPLFEAGMRYRFKVTQAGGQLRWSKDPIIIDNLPLLRCIDNCLSVDNKLIWESDGKTVDVLKNSAQLGSIGFLSIQDQPELSSLQGLEYLPNVGYLSLSGAPLLTGEMDLRFMKRLGTISLGSSGYTSLNVSGMTKLDGVYLWTTNIETINTEGASALRSVRLSNSPVASIDLSTNNQLMSFYSYHSNGDDGKARLSSVNWPTNRENLTSITLWWDELEEFNPSDFPNLTDLTLFRMPLTELVFSVEAPKLESLKVNSCQLTKMDVTNCPSLTYLSAYYNQLTSLDVSKNTKLTYMYLQGNQLQTLDVSQNPNLTNLNVTDNRLRKLDVSKTLQSDSWRLDCGNQQDGIILQLVIRDDQQTIWNQQKNNSSNRNVELFGKGTGGTGPDFGNGGKL